MKVSLLLSGHALAFAGGAIIPHIPLAGLALSLAALPIIYLGYRS